MSEDTVDDLHAAEDHAEMLRQAVLRVFEARVTMRSDETAAFVQAKQTYEAALTALSGLVAEQWSRPGCAPEDESMGADSGCIEGEDCGGYHPWTEDDDG